MATDTVTAPSRTVIKSRSVIKKVRGMAASDGAGVRLTRMIGGPALPDLDPFLMLDEFRSDQASDYIAGFPDHPHRGFETVTYMLAGRMRHGDNKGNVGLLAPGSVQWMTAGRGIVHSEMPEQEQGLMWGFQLWVNLPAAEKMTAPRYQDIPPADIPIAEAGNGVRVKVIAGRFRDVQGPAQAATTAPVYLDVELPAHATVDIDLPSDHAGFVYVYEGALTVPSAISRGELAVLGSGPHLTLAAGDVPARAIVVAGRPLKEQVVKYGPFVMNSEAEIVQAIEDYQAGRF
jgi:redox-sensitive bicupin YhaK (pirin superfamily)